MKTVRGLLNVQIIKNNRSDHLLPVTDRVDDDLVRAIIEFQRRRGTAQTGLIEPDDDTFRALLEFSDPRSMRMSQIKTDSLKQAEGVSLILYEDKSPARNTTIGFGHLVHRGPINGSESEQQFRNGITLARAEEIYREDVQHAERAINGHIGRSVDAEPVRCARQLRL